MGQPSEEVPHYRIKNWPFHSETTPGQKNVAYSASVGKSKICLPPLYIQLGFIKISVKAMDKESEGFGYLRQKFPKLSEAKMKEGIFVGPQIKKLFNDQDFSTNLKSTEKRV
jgi:hypothetical protein